METKELSKEDSISYPHMLLFVLTCGVLFLMIIVFLKITFGMAYSPVTTRAEAVQEFFFGIIFVLVAGIWVKIFFIPACKGLCSQKRGEKLMAPILLLIHGVISLLSLIGGAHLMLRGGQFIF